MFIRRFRSLIKGLAMKRSCKTIKQLFGRTVNKQKFMEGVTNNEKIVSYADASCALE